MAERWREEAGAEATLVAAGARAGCGAGTATLLEREKGAEAEARSPVANTRARLACRGVAAGAS